MGFCNHKVRVSYAAFHDNAGCCAAMCFLSNQRVQNALFLFAKAFALPAHVFHHLLDLRVLLRWLLQSLIKHIVCSRIQVNTLVSVINYRLFLAHTHQGCELLFYSSLANEHLFKVVWLSWIVFLLVNIVPRWFFIWVCALKTVVLV